MANTLRRQWGLEVTLRIEPADATLPCRMAQQMRHILREAAANASRHGKARRLAITATLDAGVFRLELADDGCGLPERGVFDAAELRRREIGPRSLRGRVDGMGGALIVESTATGTRLVINIPLDAAPVHDGACR